MHVAKELVVLMDKVADKSLPKEISDIVKLHSQIAVGSTWIPVPDADVACRSSQYLDYVRKVEW